MEPTGEVSNVEQKNLYNALLYKKYCQMTLIWVFHNYFTMFSQLSQHKIPNEHPGTLKTLYNTNSCYKIGDKSYIFDSN